MMTATQVWRHLLLDVLTDGRTTSQDSAGAEWRGRTSYELIAHRTIWPMDRAVVLCPNRRIGPRFLAAEAAWILSGSNLLEDIAPFAPQLVKLSDDGVFMSGSYGPPFVDQLPYVLQTLARDQASRQAVTVSWRFRPGPLKDVPCTISLQFLIRPGLTAEPTIHTIATMRSSDCWFGVPYDIHFFAMAGAYVALHLRDRLGELKLGNVYLTAGSQHLYQLDLEPARKSIWAEPSVDVGLDTMRDDESHPVAPFQLSEFGRPRDLIQHLWAVARREPDKLCGSWLTELM